MRSYLILLTMLATLASYANDHRVSVYYGHIRGTHQASLTERPSRIAAKAFMVVDWEQTELDPDTGLENLMRVTIVMADGFGGVDTIDYTTEADAFVQVPLPGNNRGVVLATRSELSWQTLVLKGAIGSRAIDHTRWFVPLQLRGRSLAFFTLAELTVEDTRYTFNFNRHLTGLSAIIADPTAAFDTAVENAEDLAQNLH